MFLPQNFRFHALSSRTCECHFASSPGSIGGGGRLAARAPRFPPATSTDERLMELRAG